MADILEIEDGVLKKMYGQRCCERFIRILSNKWGAVQRLPGRRVRFMLILNEILSFEIPCAPRTRGRMRAAPPHRILTRFTHAKALKGLYPASE